MLLREGEKSMRREGVFSFLRIWATVPDAVMALNYNVLALRLMQLSVDGCDCW
jgi:hypothetical protein